MMTHKEIKIIDAARSVFLRYGYKRVTMQDIAEAAGISRPAIYLVFSTKEEIFKAVIKHMATESLNEIIKNISHFPTPKDQLKYAFELWTIRPYESIRACPDAKELIYCAHEFSKETYEQTGAAFEALLSSIVKPFIEEHDTHSSSMIAKLLRHAVRGFKEAAQDSKELRQMIHDFLEIMLLGVASPQPIVA